MPSEHCTNCGTKGTGEDFCQSCGKEFELGRIGDVKSGKLEHPQQQHTQAANVNNTNIIKSQSTQGQVPVRSFNREYFGWFFLTLFFASLGQIVYTVVTMMDIRNHLWGSKYHEKQHPAPKSTLIYVILAFFQSRLAVYVTINFFFIPLFVFVFDVSSILTLILLLAFLVIPPVCRVTYLYFKYQELAPYEKSRSERPTTSPTKSAVVMSTVAELAVSLLFVIPVVLFLTTSITTVQGISDVFLLFSATIVFYCIYLFLTYLVFIGYESQWHSSLYRLIQEDFERYNRDQDQN